MNAYKWRFTAILLGLITTVTFSNLTYSQALTSSEIIEKAWPCVVKISVLDKNDDYFTGTGFLISPNKIITCKHLLDEACYATISFEDDTDAKVISNENVTILKIGKNADLALLEVDTPHQSYLTLEEMLEYRPGQAVYTVGFPLGGHKTASEGIISTKILRGSKIGFTAPVSSGNSGSPVLNQKGNVVGVFFAGVDEGQNLNSAISIKTIQEFLAQPDKPFKLSSGDIPESEDSAPFIESALREAKKAGLDVVNFIVFTGRGIFFTVVDIISLLVIILFIIAAVRGIYRAFSGGTFIQKLKKLSLVFLTSSMVIIWLIIGISLYYLLYPLIGKDGFVVDTAVFVTSIIIGTIFYFMMKKIWNRHAKAT